MKVSGYMQQWETSRITRIFMTVLVSVTLIYTIVLNGLAGPGAGPFTQSTGDISDQFQTCITPAGFTFIIWSVIYICLALIVIYAISLLFRKLDGEPAWKAGGAISISFLLVLFVNLNLNVGWLFAWDAANVTGSTILLLLIALTNGIAITLSLSSFAKAAPYLWANSKLDFWAGVLCINGYGFYDMWTTLAALINLSIFFIYEVKVPDANSVCLGMLIFLLVVLVIYFILENSVLKVFGNPLVTHYLVVIWAMIGIYAGTKTLASSAVLSVLTGACFLLLGRIGALIYRNWNNKIYRNIEA